MGIFSKFAKFIVFSAIVAGVTKAGTMLVQKLNEDGDFESKACTLIDSQTEKANKLAKAGVSKAISMTQDQTNKELP